MPRKNLLYSALLAAGAIFLFLLALYLRQGTPLKSPEEKTKPRETAQEPARLAPSKEGEATSPQAPSGEASESRKTPADALQALAGRVISEGSLAPIQGAVVHVALDVPKGSTEQISWVASGKTDARGCFVLQGLDQAPYRLRASGAGFMDKELRPVFPTGSLEIILPRDAGIPCVLELDEEAERQPLPGQRIVLEIPREGWALEARSDAQGSFAITGVERKRLDDAYRLGELEATVPDFTQPDVVPSASGEGYTFVVEKGALVFGQVTDRATKGPIPRATILSDSGQAVTADDDGKYRISGVTDGLTAFAPGYAALTRELDDSSDESIKDSVRVDFRLRRGLTLHGRVTDSAGSPLPQVRIGLPADALDLDLESGGLESKLRDALHSLTDAEGHYRLEGLPSKALDLPGSLELQVRPPGSANGVTEEVDVENEEGDLEHNIVLDVVGSCRGTVARCDKSPLGGACLILESLAEELYQGAGTDGEGKFEFKNIPRGEYRLSVILDEKPIHIQVVSVPSEPLEIHLEPGTTVTGTVVFKDEREPIPDLRVDLVFFRAELSLSREALTDAAGRFSFEEVPPGEYTLEIKPPTASPPFLSLGPMHRVPVNVTQEGWSGEVSYPSFPSAWVTLNFVVTKEGETKSSLEPLEVRVISFHSTGAGVRDWSSRNGAILGRAAGTFRARLREGTYVLRCAMLVDGKERTKDEALTLQAGQTLERQVVFSD